MRDRLGYVIAGPAEGALAAGEGEGPGRMLEPRQIEEAIGRALARDEAFVGRRVLVTGGPTREPIDPVRYVGNRSSGRMGYAISQAAWRRGADVTLVSGPSSLEHPYGVDVVRVETAEEMLDAVSGLLPSADVSVFAAAVADFRPDDPKDEKVKREDTGDELTVSMTANPDIAGGTAAMRKPGSVAVGFALETAGPDRERREEAREKGFQPRGSQ